MMNHDKLTSQSRDQPSTSHSVCVYLLLILLLVNYVIQRWCRSGNEGQELCGHSSRQTVWHTGPNSGPRLSGKTSWLRVPGDRVLLASMWSSTDETWSFAENIWDGPTPLHWFAGTSNWHTDCSSTTQVPTQLVWAQGEPAHPPEDICCHGVKSTVRETVLHQNVFHSVPI